MPERRASNKKKSLTRRPRPGKQSLAKMTPANFAKTHSSVMNDIVPAIRKGADAKYIYSYIIKFGIKNKLIAKKDGGKFLKFCLDTYHISRHPDFYDLLDVSEPVRKYAKSFSKTVRSSSQKNVVKRVEALNKKLKKPAAKTEVEKVIVKYIKHGRMSCCHIVLPTSRPCFM